MGRFCLDASDTNVKMTKGTPRELEMGKYNTVESLARIIVKLDKERFANVLVYFISRIY